MCFDPIPSCNIVLDGDGSGTNLTERLVSVDDPRAVCGRVTVCGAEWGMRRKEYCILASIPAVAAMSSAEL